MPIDYATDLRLEVEELTDDLRNEIPNPSGELGGWGWVTPLAGTAIETIGTLAGGDLQLSYHAPGGDVASYFYSESWEHAAGRYAAARWQALPASGSAGRHKARFEWLNAAGVVIGSSAQSTDFLHSSSAVRVLAAVAAPAGTAYGRLRFDTYDADLTNPTTTLRQNVTGVTVATAATAGELATIRRNLVANPRVNNGVSTPGWSLLSAAFSGTTGQITQSGSADEFSLMTSDARLFAVEPLKPYTASAESVHDFDAVNGGGRVLLSMLFYAAGGAQLAHPLGPEHFLNPGATMAIPAVTFTAPAGAATGRLMATFLPDIPAPGVRSVDFDQLMVEQTDTAGAYFDGATVDAGGWSYDYVDGTQGSASVAVLSALAYLEPIPYVNVLGSSAGIEVKREELNLGTLTATIIDPALDASQADAIIAEGRRCRLTVAAGGVAEVLFAGEIDNAKVKYLPKRPDPAKRVRVTLLAVDPTKVLGNVPRPEGVAELAELPYVLEGAGVPWNVNGSGDQVATAVVVATNPDAKLLDQVALTRDSNLARAWVDRRGVLQVWDTALLSTVPVAVLDESVYSDVDVDFDSDRVIDAVTVTVVTELGETTFGPYLAPGVVRPSHAQDFRVQRLEVDVAWVEAYAAAILDANAVAAVRINAVTIPVRETATALLDLYDLVTASNDVAAISSDVRIAGLTHKISVDRRRGGKWELEVDLVDGDRVATPQTTPPLPPSSTAQTLSKALRPVGEVTMFYGLPSAVPDGWLTLNGATVATMATDYPDLYAFLGTNVLPDFTDRIPVGAGVKAVGAASGSWTTTLGVANLPRRASATAFGTASSVATPTASGVLSPADPVDFTPRVRALYFIIRAR